MGTFRVGFGRADITPLESCQLGGLGGVEGSRMSTELMDRLYTICVAITDENDETVIFNVNDLCQIIDLTGMKEPTMQATGVPYDRIFLAATHTHSAPGLEYEMPQAERYKAMVADRIAIAAAQAMTDRKPARMEIASVQTKNMNFSRRYINTLGGIFNNINGTIRVGPENQADPQLQLLKFVREGGKDIILTNFQTHHRGASAQCFTGVSYDFFGAYRDHLEEHTGCHVAYFSGAGGNLAAYNNYEKELNVSKDYRDHGVKLAEFALQAENFKPLKAGPIRVIERIYTGTVNKSPELEEIATIARNISEYERDEERAKEMIKGTPIKSMFHARGIYNNSLLPETFDVKLIGVSIGDWAIATAPCEMYDINGKEIKDNSPFAATMVFQLCNGSIGYIPSEIAYSHGGYEIEVTKFKKGTGEGFRETFLNMFKEMKEMQ